MSYPLLLQVSQPVPAAILMICAWTLLIASGWRFWITCKSGIKQLRKLHDVPCDRCLYFTGNYHLKCTVHPHKALTELAIGCHDFVGFEHHQRTKTTSQTPTVETKVGYLGHEMRTM